MLGSKYGKYIVTELHQPQENAPWTPKFKPEELVHVRYLDSNVLKGAFYVVTAWTFPPFVKETRGKAHKHNWDEVLAFFGGNPDNPNELYAELEVNLGDEVHTVTKSCLIFIPKGVMHSLRFIRIEKPIFHFACGKTKKYYE
jgi:hypothetical protein